jgi:transposase
MQGTVLYGPRDVRVEERPAPTIVEPTDAVIRLSATCICGSDLWPYRGISATNGPTPMGHEYCGIVEEVGRAVTSIKPGKRPSPTALLGEATEQIRELVRLRVRLVQDFGDRQRQRHRLVDLCFPEFTRHVRDLDSALARAVLREFPTAEAFRGATVRGLARLRYGCRYAVGVTLGRELIEAAKVSVGRHQGVVYDHQVQYICDELGTLATKIHELDSDIEGRISQHELGALLTTIDGIGPLGVGRAVAEHLPDLGEGGAPPHHRGGKAVSKQVGAASLVRGRPGRARAPRSW